MRGWLMVLLAGCYSPSYTNGGFLCGKCPEGYHCAIDGTCWKNGEAPDLAGASADLATGDLAHSPLPEGGVALAGAVDPLGGGQLSNGSFFLSDQSLVLGDSSCVGNLCLIGGITP
jgi:hypothetical protein